MPTSDFYTDISLRNNELRDFVVHRAAEPPAITASSKAGQLYYDTSRNALFVLVPSGTGGALRWERVFDGVWFENSPYAMNLRFLAPVRLATTPADLTTATVTFAANSGELTLENLPAGQALPKLDGVELAVNDRILLKDLPQGQERFNGIWVVQSGDSDSVVLQRAADANEDSELTIGMLVRVQAGQQNAGRLYQLVGQDEDIDINVTPLIFRAVEGDGIPHAVLSLGAGLEFFTPTAIGLKGISALAPGDLLVGAANNGFSRLAAGQPNSLLGLNAQGMPAWVGAPLGVEMGGTGLNSIAANALLVGGANNTLTALAPGSEGEVLSVTATGLAWQMPLRRFVAEIPAQPVDPPQNSVHAYTLQHNLGTMDVVVNIWDTSTQPYEQQTASVALLDDNSVRVSFSSAHTSVRVVVIG